MGSTLAIEVTRLSKTYSSSFGLRRKLALQDVSLSVAKGQVVSLLGPNGAGKTTLVKILLGLLRPSHGTAQIAGQPAGSVRSRRHIGYLPENLFTATHHTAHSALVFWGRLHGIAPAESRSRREALLDAVGLAAAARVPVKQFSKGMRQRLGLAGALLHQPDLLILDEPTDGLDPAGRKMVRDLIFEAKREGKTIFLNSHLLQEVEQISDQVAILDQGTLKYCGAISGLQQKDTLRIELELRGAETEAQAALDLYGEVDLQRVDEQRYRVRLNLADQSAVDQCIDGLRAGGISILSLKQLFSLEGAFLKIVAPDDEGEDSA